MRHHDQTAGNETQGDGTTILRTIWETWLRVGRFIGDWIARFVLTLFYFTILVPFGLIAQLTGDPLSVKSNPGSTNWLERNTRDLTRDDIRRQY